MESGMIGDKEVEMHRLAKFVWAIDIIKHTSEDTKELVYGWVVGDEQKAHDLYHEKVNELKHRKGSASVVMRWTTHTLKKCVVCMVESVVNTTSLRMSYYKPSKFSLLLKSRVLVSLATHHMTWKVGFRRNEYGKDRL